MKRIILSILLLFSLAANSQTWTPIAGKQRFTTGFGLPVKDSSFYTNGYDTALLYVNPNDSSLYWRFKGYHKKVNYIAIDSVTRFGGLQTIYQSYLDSLILATAINGKPTYGDVRQTVSDSLVKVVKYTDTASMLSGYQTQINARLRISDSSTYQPKFRSDTARINLYGNIKANKDSITAKSTYSKGLTVYGNSISAGTGASVVTNGYAFILARQINGQFLNYGNSGDQVADLTYRWQFPTSNPVGNGTDPTTVIEIGTNDVTQYNTNTDKQTIFKRGIMAALTWAAIPSANKKLGQAFTLSGFAATDSIQKGVAIKSTTNGNTATTTITTLASSYIYVWYLIRDGNLGSFTVSIDGVLQTDNYNGTTTIYNYGDNGATIATQNGYTSGIACNRFAVASAGSHTVVITNNSTTGQNVTILGIGTNPATSTLNPTVIYVTPNQQNNANNSLSGTYSSFATSIATTLASDRLNVLIADTRSALGNNFATYYADAIHPNDAGHAKMDSVIIATVPSLNVGSVIPNPYVPQSVYQYTQPVNARQFWSPNAGNLNSTTQYNSGIKYLTANGNDYFVSPQVAGGLGIYHGFPNTGGTIVESWGPYPTVTSGYPSSVPPANLNGMYMTIQSNGIVRFFTASDGTTSTLKIQGGSNVTIGAESASQGGNALTIATPNTYIMASTAATSGANVNSANLSWGANVWNGSASVRKDVGFRHVPASGTNPSTSLRLYIGNNPGGNFNIDLSAATDRNKLGFVNLTNTTSGAAGTDSVLVKAANGDVAAISPLYYQTYGNNVSQSLTAATTVTVTIGATMANTNYKAVITPTNATAATTPYYVTNKTTTIFDVVYTMPITGTVTFDWIVKP